MLSHQPICIEYQDENNNILGMDTSELRFGIVRNSSSSWKLVLELSSLNHICKQALTTSKTVLIQMLTVVLHTSRFSAGDYPGGPYVNKPGGYTCTCPEGLSGDPMSGCFNMTLTANTAMSP